MTIYPTNTTPNSAEPTLKASPTALNLWGGGGGIVTECFDSVASGLDGILQRACIDGCILSKHELPRAIGNEQHRGSDDDDDDDEEEEEEQ